MSAEEGSRSALGLCALIHRSACWHLDLDVGLAQLRLGAQWKGRAQGKGRHGESARSHWSKHTCRCVYVCMYVCIYVYMCVCVFLTKKKKGKERKKKKRTCRTRDAQNSR